MAKLWQGRFAAGAAGLLERFSESISYDRQLAAHDIQGSLAHAKMLQACGLISQKDLSAIRRGLKTIAAQIAAGEFAYNIADEDIHMAIEAALTRLIGEAGKKLHTARSRNDQVATDLRLWTREKIAVLDKALAGWQAALVQTASRHEKIVIPGFTHLQRAQPIMLGQHLLAYVEMLHRDRGRLADAGERLNYMPLGAGALAGTTLPIDRRLTCKELGFKAPCANSLDAVSDRDFVVEVLSALSLLFSHISRFAEDAILWASAEWNLLQLPDAWSTGSSIMPQKRNPDVLELARGKSGRVTGALIGLLTTLKGLPLTYNRDLQEDKEPLFDAVGTAELTLACLTEFTRKMKFRPAAAAKLLAGGFLDATALAEYLVERGLPFRDCHAAAGRLVRLAEEKNSALADLTLKEMQTVCPLIEQNVYKCLAPAKTPGAYKSQGSASPKELRLALGRWQKALGLPPVKKGKR